MILIDKDSVKFTDFEIAMCGGDFKKAFKLLCEKLDDTPIVDAIPVVRCRDCIYYKNENHLISESVDPPYGFCGTINRYIPETFYCAYGERRENDI